MRECNLVSVASIANDPSFAALFHVVTTHPLQIPQMELDNLILLIYVLHQKYTGPCSQISGYLATIPTEYNSSSYWPDEFLRLLAGSVLCTATLARREELLQLHQCVFSLLDTVLPAFAAYFTWENFIWAMTTIDSRAFRVLKDGSDATILAPFADLINHSFEGQIVSKRFDAKARELVLAANGPVGPGELLMSYGDMDNARLLLFYGFAVDDNPYDCVELLFEPPEGDSTATLKCATLASMNCSLENYLKRDLSDVPKTVLALRILLLGDDAYTEVALRQVVSGTLEHKTGYPLGPIVSVEHEQAVLDTMCNVLADLYQQYAAMSAGLRSFDYSAVTHVLCFFRGQLEIITIVSSYLAHCATLLTATS